MPTKETGPATDPEVREWSGGFSWVAHPGEDMQRASHALLEDGEAWLVDPLDFDGLDDRLADAGDVAGVVVLLDRHGRDAAELARRHGVAVHLPAWLSVDLDAPVERFEDRLADTDYAARRVLDTRVWGECALRTDETLLVPEAVGSSAFFRTGEERLGVHPALRLFPPRGPLRDLDPERVLTGHGVGVFEDGGRALRDALAGSRRRAPAYYAGLLRDVLSG